MFVQPATRSATVTPSDSALQSLTGANGRKVFPRALLVGAAGTVRGVLAGDWQDQVQANPAVTPATATTRDYLLPAGLQSMAFAIIYSTGTTATGLVVLD